MSGPTVGPPGPAPSRSGSLGPAVAVVLVLAAVAIFMAGLSLGGGPGGADADERTAVQAFLETYRRIDHDYVGRADPHELVQGAIKGMFDTLDDPYSGYMAPDEYEATLSGISGEFEGIGARMGTVGPGGATCDPIGPGCRLLVTEVLPRSPAQRAGLLEDDAVEAVDGRPLAGETLDTAVLLIRGPRGSTVTLTVDRGGVARDVAITRDVVSSRDVSSAVLDDGQVGYLRVDSFSSSAADDFKAALGAHLEAGIDELVVDVRGDPGGFVDMAVAIASQFIADGPVFWEETADGTRHAVDVQPGGLATHPGVSVVVLIDGASASASEILAAALHDAGRAELIGETTFGKGTVQEWTQLPGGSGGFRLSIARWLTRDQDWIDGIGIAPDVLVPGGLDRFRPGRDDGPGDDAQLAAALDWLDDGAVAPSPGPGGQGILAPATSATPVTAPAGAPSPS